MTINILQMFTYVDKTGKKHAFLSLFSPLNKLSS